MPKGMIRGGSKRLSIKARRASQLAGQLAEAYRQFDMPENHTLWNTVADRYGEAADGLQARRRGARMDGGMKRKGIYKMQSPILKAAYAAASDVEFEKAWGKPPKPRVPRNSVGQPKPKGVKAFRMGNIRILVGRGKDGQTRINWGRVAKARARLLAAIG